MTVTSKLKRLTKKLSAVPQIVCPLDKNRKKLKGQFGAWLLDDLLLGGSILQLTLTTLHLQNGDGKPQVALLKVCRSQMSNIKFWNQDQGWSGIPSFWTNLDGRE